MKNVDELRKLVKMLKPVRALIEEADDFEKARLVNIESELERLEHALNDEAKVRAEKGE